MIRKRPTFRGSLRLLTGRGMHQSAMEQLSEAKRAFGEVAEILHDLQCGLNCIDYSTGVLFEALAAVQGRKVVKAIITLSIDQ